MELQIEKLTMKGKNVVLNKDAVVAGGIEIRFSRDGKINDRKTMRRSMKK